MIQRRILPCMVLLKKKNMPETAVLDLFNTHGCLDLNTIQYTFLPTNTRL